MTLKGWFIIASVCGALVVSLVVFVFVFRGSWGYKTLGGPVAVVTGEPPKHGFLGVGFGDATVAPLTIQSVLAGSGAAEAGLQPGDVILAAHATEKPNFAELQRVIHASVPGEELLLKIGRGPDEMEVRVGLISFTDLVVLQEQDRRAEPVFR